MDAMCNVLFIDWQPEQTAFLGIRWYALFWILGLLGAYIIVRKLYRGQGIPDEKYDPLFIYCFIGVLAGARLGHCLFYEPGYFLGSGKGLIEMILPIRFAQASWDWHFTGYAGLASHGGAIGIFIATILYVHMNHIKFMTVMDNICISVPFAAGCIRLGNLMNSEIIGSPTELPWGFIFHTNEALVNGQLTARHPSQLYESIAYFVIFALVLWMYRNKRECVGTGFYFGIVLLCIFVFRFFVEFIKLEQVEFEQGMLLDMGQLLSIPFIIVGAYFTFRPLKR
ncbi:MAG: prolipoprotein diacylglyceryl transferase [Bacteroidaceae bacterium]|nr:prolipoprotein diacylglyceryl transferase [Bacteroidaceae bacterium]